MFLSFIISSILYILKTKAVDLTYFPFIFYFHLLLIDFPLFLFLELRVKVKVTISGCHTSVTSDNMVTVIVTSYEMHKKI